MIEIMKANKFPFRKIDEVVDDIVGSKTFRELETFADYWQITQDGKVQETNASRCKSEYFLYKVILLWSYECSLYLSKNDG